MAQIKIYAVRESLDAYQSALSDAIHAVMVDVLRLPMDKRFYRFMALSSQDFIFPSDRSAQYTTIIEISMFEGRNLETKKRLIHSLFETIHKQVGISPQDIEITLFETPKYQWGIRGMCGDELSLNYNVNV
jgi:phenylpyruvate tautomerase PptA (4-oxalocrotonate tautomerase family)